MQESKNITQKSASNLALAFILLPREKRDGMSALYAFCREVDDVADEETVPVELRRSRLEEWRKDVRLACNSGSPQFAVNQELKAIIQKYSLKFELFDELIKGVEMDLDIQRYETYEALEHYCYRVASVVGLLSIEIFGYKNPECTEYAILLGKALQLTNILRDVRLDAERGRIYLPLSELRRFKVTEEEILRHEYSPRYCEMARSIGARTNDFYKRANLALPREDRRSMVAAELMGSVYWRLLKKLESQDFDVFGPTLTRLTKAQKILLIIRAGLRTFSGALMPNYGTT